MMALSFVAMYVLMYAIVDRFANVYPNLNQFYMAGLMAAPMVLIELAVMGSMYVNRKANIAIAAVTVVALVGSDPNRFAIPIAKATRGCRGHCFGGDA